MRKMQVSARYVRGSCYREREVREGVESTQLKILNILEIMVRHLCSPTPARIDVPTPGRRSTPRRRLLREPAGGVNQLEV